MFTCDHSSPPKWGGLGRLAKAPRGRDGVDYYTRVQPGVRFLIGSPEDTANIYMELSSNHESAGDMDATIGVTRVGIVRVLNDGAPFTTAISSDCKF